jgi:ERCC4-type nuclease
MILIDDRQGSVELRRDISTPSVICRLDYADFAFAGEGPDGAVSIGVERKTLLDLLGSMSSGRLSGHQIAGMQDMYDFVYLLVEGVWKSERNTGALMQPSGKSFKPVVLGTRRFMARELWAFLNNLSVICNVIVVRTANKADSGKWLDSVYGWWNKPWHRHKAHDMWHKPAERVRFVKPTLTERIWAQFDGISQDRAKALAKKFPRIGDVIFTDPEDLMQVEGIGKKIAQSIIQQREK